MIITHYFIGRRLVFYEMILDGALIRALVCAAERCGGAVKLGRRTGIDPSLISRYMRGKVRAVSDENWNKLQTFLPAVDDDLCCRKPVLEWRELQKDPAFLWRSGVVKELVLRAHDLQMAPQICDRDIIVVRQKESLKTVPDNKIVVVVFKAQEKFSAVCRRVRRINGCCWLFSDEPQGLFFPGESVETVWVGVVLRKICEL